MPKRPSGSDTDGDGGEEKPRSTRGSTCDIASNAIPKRSKSRSTDGVMTAAVEDPNAIIRQEVGERIRRRRESIGMSQSGLADVLGVRQAEVSRWETGHVGPRPDTLARIADALDTDWRKLAHP